MAVAKWTERFLVAAFWLSPYKWADAALAHWERGRAEVAGDWQSLRDLRYSVSDTYITSWLVVAVALWWANPILPAWLVWPALVRVFGVLQKELGVILFGKCKITEGRMVAATGRAIVLALVNYFAVAFLFGFVYAKKGLFTGVSAEVPGLGTADALVQALTVHFSLGPAYEPADTGTWLLVVAQMGFVFLFSVIVISLFISLLNMGAKKA